MVIPPEVHLLHKIVQDCFRNIDFFCSLVGISFMKLSIILSQVIKIVLEFMGITFNLWILFGNVHIFILLILPINEH
jgi:ABC-type transport system involved in multi-copper enzyme maturation permease subunit